MFFLFLLFSYSKLRHRAVRERYLEGKREKRSRRRARASALPATVKRDREGRKRPSGFLQTEKKMGETENWRGSFFCFCSATNRETQDRGGLLLMTETHKGKLLVLCCCCIQRREEKATDFSAEREEEEQLLCREK